ncbi:Hint domain-containing protein [Yoonia sp. SS1-5]|uniref:Hint domain-containing protein n=1 Tax=Yoonia rhodophyticola TaxID=3137370 RepID=A0AAN0M7H7_9RHOB
MNIDTAKTAMRDAVRSVQPTVPCFTPGTRIATPKGERLVEHLQIGDRVLTRDNGIQQIAWVGDRQVSMDDLKAMPKLRPVLIRAGSLGDHMPERDMLVSPYHRMLIVSEMARTHFYENEVFVAATHLTKLDGVETVNVPGTSYIHFMFDDHQAVLADGTWSESFQPSAYTLGSIVPEQRDELFALFPELETKEGVKKFRAARKTLSKLEALLPFR